MNGCVYCGSEPTQPFTADFEFPVCRACGIAQHEALERIAQMVRPVWRRSGTAEEEGDP
jgi:hypothetical protein